MRQAFHQRRDESRQASRRSATIPVPPTSAPRSWRRHEQSHESHFARHAVRPDYVLLSLARRALFFPLPTVRARRTISNSARFAMSTVSPS